MDAVCIPPDPLCFCRVSISPPSAGCKRPIVAPSLENCLQLKEATSSGRLYHKPLTPWSGAANNPLILRHKSPAFASSWDQLCGTIHIPELPMDQMEVRHQWRTQPCLAPSPDLLLFPQSLSPKTSTSLYCVSRKPCLRLCFQETRSKALMLKKNPYT